MSGPNRLKITWTFGLCTWSGIHLSVELPPFVTTSKQMTACSLMWVRNFVYSFCSGQNCTGNAFHPRSFLYWFTPEDQLQQPSVVHTLRIFAHNYGIGLVVITTKIKPFINVLYSWKLCLKRKIKPIWIGTQSKFKRQNVRLKDEFKKCSLFYFFFQSRAICHSTSLPPVEVFWVERQPASFNPLALSGSVAQWPACSLSAYELIVYSCLFFFNSNSHDRF